MGSFGHLLGIAYQIHDDLLDWNNEDRLFNMLVKNNEQSVEFVAKMEKLFLSYSNKAKNELRKVADSVSKKHLEHLSPVSFYKISTAYLNTRLGANPIDFSFRSISINIGNGVK